MVKSILDNTTPGRDSTEKQAMVNRQGCKWQGKRGSRSHRERWVLWAEESLKADLSSIEVQL